MRGLKLGGGEGGLGGVSRRKNGTKGGGGEKRGVGLETALAGHSTRSLNNRWDKIVYTQKRRNAKKLERGEKLGKKEIVRISESQ